MDVLLRFLAVAVCRRGRRAGSLGCFVAGLPLLPALITLPSLAQDGIKLQMAWDPSPDTNVAGYLVYYGFAPAEYERIAFAGARTNVTILDLPGGRTCYLAAVSYTLEGAMSDLSVEISHRLPAVPPPNLPPSLDPIPNLLLTEGSFPLYLPLTGISAGDTNAGQTLRVTVSSSNPELIPDPAFLPGPAAAAGILVLTPAPEGTGFATISVKIDDGAARSNTVTRSFLVTVGSPRVTTAFLEAEQGTLGSPMRLVHDSRASGASYVTSPVDNQGRVDFHLDVPESGEYVVWCRVISPDDATDSFFVSLDGGEEDIYDTSPNTWGTAWQWTRLNGRVAGNPRRLVLARGTHTLSFRGRESDTSLDAIYFSNDPQFQPVQLQATTVRTPQLGRQLSFTLPAGYRGDLQASEDLTNWVSIWQSPGTVALRKFSYVDTASTSSGRRFYRLLVLPATEATGSPLRLALTAVPSPGFGMQLSFQAQAGARYAVEASEDLRTWLPIWQTGVAPSSALFAFVDLELIPAGRRFYRLIQE